MSQRSFVFLSVISLLVAAGCGDKKSNGEGGSSSAGAAIGQSAAIDTDPAQRISFSDVILGEGLETPYKTVVVRNVGGSNLIIEAIYVEEDDNNPEFKLATEVPRFENGDNAGQLREDVLPDELCPIGASNIKLSPDEEFGYCVLFVLYDPNDQEPDFGRLVIESNDPVTNRKVIDLETLVSGPKLALVPAGDVIFEDVLRGTTENKNVVLRNVGSADLIVDQITMPNDASGDFSFKIADNSPHTTVPATLKPQVDDDFVLLEITYAPTRPGNDTGSLKIRSNDAEQGEKLVNLVAKSIYPCISVTPNDINFRQVLIGTSDEQTIDVTNCGNAPVTVSSLQIVEGTSPDFSIKAALEGLSEECKTDPTLLCEGEAILEGNETRSFIVTYAPAEEGPDAGRIALSTNVQGFETVEVALVGRGTHVQPPICLAEARIAGAPDWGTYPDVENLLETIPLKTVELTASNSFDADGSIESYRWTLLEGPEDSTAQVQPHDRARDATFFLDLAGQYVFDLQVTDNFGVTNTEPCRVYIKAIPDEDIHVQLVWDTPADADQTDEGFGAGSDVDLHVIHPLGQWFCAPRDTYYANPNPDWGTPFDPSDDPSLDIDDTDGAGPENINLNNPESQRLYRVGAHYFNDHGYGPSFVTIRIYIQGTLRFELANKRMAGTDQFWDVATIAWPSGIVATIDQLLDAPPEEQCR